ncbi:MAG: tetratricopeptide repeat protein, partial [Bradymonadaceae bacterium]
MIDLLENSIRFLRKKDGELEVMLDLANTLWDQTEWDQAEYYFKRIKLLDNEHPDVYAFYEDFYERQGEWRKLFALLSGKLQALQDPEEKRHTSERLAEIAEVELGSPEKAIDVWKSYLREHPADADVRRRLRHLYEDNQKWNALVDLLKDDFREIEEGEGDFAAERIQLLEEMAHIYRAHMNLDTMVINILGQILEIEPRHATAFSQLRELYEANRRFTDLAALLAFASEDAVNQGDLAGGIELFIEIADIWQERLNNVTQAIPYLERIIELAPDHDSTRRRLSEIYEQRRDFKSLFDLRLTEAELLDGPSLMEHLEGLLELAEDRLRDGERAVRVLARIMELKPGDESVAARLEGIYRRHENWPELVDLLAKKAEVETDARVKVAYLREAATIAQDHISDAPRATELWLGLLQNAPDDEEGLTKVTGLLLGANDFDGLDGLYRKRGDFESLFDLFDRGADTLEDMEEQRTLYRRMATLAEKDLQDVDRVILSLEQIRNLSSDPVEIIAELIGWYKQTGEVAREIELNRVLLEHSDSADGRFELFLELADLESRRDDALSALGWQLKAVALRPDDESTIRKAEEFGRGAGTLDALVQELDDIADILDDEPAQEAIWHRVARILWQDLERHDDAIARFERLRERHPQDLEFLDALEALYELASEPHKRIAVLREQMDVLTQGGAEQGDLVDQLSKIADVQRTHLGEQEAARATYMDILDRDPNHLLALRGVRELHRAEEDWPEVRDCLLRELSLSSYESDGVRYGLQMELAAVYREQLDDLFEALRYYGQVLAEAPDHEGALNAVEELLTEPRLARDAALMLEPIFRDLDRVVPLARALEARLDICTDQFEEQEILDELIPLYSERLEDTSTAFERACRQFELDAERDDIWLRVEQLGASLNQWPKIEEMFSRHSPLEGFDSPTRYDLLRHLAAIREHRLNKKEEALLAWERLHEYDPMDSATLEALERLYRPMARIADLVRVLIIRADLVEMDEDRVEILLEAGRLYDEILDEPADAIEIYRRILLIESEHEEAVEVLERLYEREEAWHDLDELLAIQADATLEPDRKRVYLLKLAILRAEKMNDQPGAVNILQQLLEDDPGDDEALDAMRALDGRLQEKAGAPELRLDIAHTLEPLYRIRGEYDRLVETLNTRLQFADLPFEKVELLDEIATLC